MMNHCKLVGSQVPTVVNMKRTVTWDVTPSSEVQQYFRECTASIFRVDEQPSKLSARSSQL
jgi:hypothetical protein